ncbi:hypothetical protein H9P43_008452 [Blastocladiella emersonii ATCC 22665]|nr:hypothetical protein H9P43_008452 [Blastocladiella emersonii ATCC 22665]
MTAAPPPPSIGFLDLVAQYAGDLSVATVVATALALVVPYLAFRLYKSTIVPPELAHLPRVPIWDSMRALFTPGGYIAEAAVQGEAASKWCVANGLDKDAWRDMYLIWLFGTWGAVVGKPEYIRSVFLTTESFPKFLPGEVGMDLNAKYLGINVVLSNGPIWKLHRKVTNPAFHRSWSTTIMGDTGRVLLAELDKVVGQAADPFDWMQRATLDVLSLAAFGRCLNSLTNPHAEIVDLYNGLMHDLQWPLFTLLPVLQRTRLLPRVRDLHRRIDKFDEFIYSVIDAKERDVRERLARGETKDEKEMDLLERMLEVSVNDATFTRQDLRSNVVIFFVAGHDTTTAALTTVLYYLGLHPEVQAKARAEVAKIMGTMDPATPAAEFPYPTTQEQAGMDYLTFIIKESLRLYPSVTGLPLRRAAKPVNLGTTAIPKDTPIHVDIFGVHRNQKYWGADADKFVPERWASYTPPESVAAAGGLSASMNRSASTVEKEAGKVDASGTIPMMPSAHGFSWVPFGGGQRLCLGQQFSLIEQRVILSMMLSRYSWSVVGDENAVKGTPTSSSGVLLHPAKVQLKFQRL